MNGLAARSAALSLMLASAAFAQTATTTTCDEHEGCGKGQMLRLRQQAGLPIGEPWSAPGYSSREAMGDTDVLGYVLDIEVDPVAETIAGSNTITVKSLVNNLTQFTFVLRNQYVVSSILVNGVTPVTATTPAANSYQRRITLDRAYSAGEVFTIRIAYSGTAVARGFGSIDFSYQNNNTARPRTVATLSEAYFAATWWPCKDGDVFLAGDNSDKATIDLSVTAPSIYRTVSNGLLQSVMTPAAGKSKYRWVSNYPTATYLVAFSTTVYNTWTVNYTYPLPGGGTGSMPVEFNIYPTSDSPGNRAAWERTVPMLATFRPFYGEYPFVNEKYGIYQFNFGGGMEHQTNSGQGTFNESVTAHELAHQWWGDDVTCKTWSDIWLNEGFASYSECLWAEQKTGTPDPEAYRAAILARKPDPVSDSVYVTNVADMNRIFSGNYTYDKGGWVLHQLRHVVGDETFYNILRTYRTAYQGSAATTDDFAAVASSVAGRDLTWFFRQWVYGFGAPEYAMGTQPVTIHGNSYLRVSLRQTQDSTWPGNGAPAGYFAAPIDLRVDTSSGPQTFILNNTARSQTFLLPITGTFGSATLDPSDWVLNTGKDTEAYQPGPPRIVSASPAPSATIGLGTPVNAVTIAFSDNVTASAAAFTLNGPSGAVPFSYAYSAPTTTATLSLSQPLTAGTYTVAIAPTVTANSQALDGELPGTALVNNASPLPSGNGLAGGAASFTFTVEGSACGTSDYNGDGDFGTDADIEAFFACLAGSCCPTCFVGGSDFNADGDFGTDADIESFFRVLAGGTC